MPEIKHHFRAGRMNKDLDERLVPNGEYRDAQNIEISTSEGSDVGSVQNVVGTTLKDIKTYNNSTGITTNWNVASDSIKDLTSPQCIGSIADTQNNKIYWFIAATGVSAIAEYDEETGVVSPVLVDKNSILNFSTDYPITGVNVLGSSTTKVDARKDRISDFLLWTDNQTEPKKINIKIFKSGSTDFDTHTQFTSSLITGTVGTSNDFTEDDITTIKLAPLKAPTLDMHSSKRGGIGTSGNAVLAAKNDFSAFPSNKVRGGQTFEGDGSKLEFTLLADYFHTDFNAITLIQGLETRGNLKVFVNGEEQKSGVSYGFTGTGTDSDPYVGKVTFTPNTLGKGPTAGSSILIKENINEIKKYTLDLIPNTSTELATLQYKKDDFIVLTYIEGETEYKITAKVDSVKNLPKLSIVIQSIPEQVPNASVLWKILLDETDPLFEHKFVRFAYRWKYKDGEYSTFSPFSEVAFMPGEFKYKSSNGYNTGMNNMLRRLIISDFQTQPDNVDELDILYKESNSSNVYIVDTLEDRSTSYEVTSEIIGAAVPSNQLLRQWDNVPKKALSQEITANRLIYANYYQQYDMEGNNPDITVSVQNNDITTVKFPEKSIKTQRTYQLGATYKDLYGRETPVFSNNNASLKLDKSYSDNVNSLQSQLLNLKAPSWATHFKYYVKEPSNEYYNLALDRFYRAEDGNIWLSFPSSERNKVTEDSYLILKKQHDTSNPVEVPARYKILDIKNEPPKFITLQSQSKGSAFCRVLNSGNNAPGVGVSSFRFRGPSATSNPTFSNGFNSDGILSIKTSAGTTNKYKIISGGLTGDVELIGSTGAKHVYSVDLEEGFSELEDEILASSLTQAEDEFTIILYEEKEVMKPEYEGRFFVKINRDGVFDSNVIGTFSAADTEWSIVQSMNIDFNILNNPDTANDKMPYYNVKQKVYQGLGWKDTKDASTKVKDPKSSGASRTSTTIDKNAGWKDEVESQLNYPGELGTGGTETNGKKNFSFYWAGVDYGTAWANSPSSNAEKDGDNPGKGKDNVLHDETATINPFLESMSSVGTYFQFANDNGDRTVPYEITNVTKTFTWRQDKKNKQATVGGKIIEFNIEFRQVGGALGWKSDNKKFLSTGVNTQISKVFVVKEDLKIGNTTLTSQNPAVFETEPLETAELDLYYEASDALPIIKKDMKISGTGIAADTTIKRIDQIDETTDVLTFHISNNTTANITAAAPVDLTITSSDDVYSFTAKTVNAIASGQKVITIGGNQVHGQKHKLNWYNCYSFGNGVESNRIRDDFNAMFIDKAPRVSSTLSEQYKEEHKQSGLIFSGIFNSRSGVNRLNQFIQAETITKDLNPQYGSIQKLHARDNDLIALCEDKVLNIPANKDLLFNADGSANLTASNLVLGTTAPYPGEYGISKNPESFISHAYRAYFTDKSRGAVLRLSRNGLVNIAANGMTDWFKDNLATSTTLLGTYNENKGSYNLTLKGTSDYTVSFDERITGWPSFKSFIPESGLSLNNKYYTFKNGDLYIHNNSLRNCFYGTIAKVNGNVSNSTNVTLDSSNSNIAVGQIVKGTGITVDTVTVASISGTSLVLSSAQTISDDVILSFHNNYETSINVMINDSPSFIKGFKTLNYEGTKSRKYTYDNDTPANTTYTKGWYCNSVTTNEQTGGVKEFVDKEGIWYNYLIGDTTVHTASDGSTTSSNLDTKEFSVQGIGQFASISGDTSIGGFDLSITISDITGMSVESVSGGNWVLETGSNKIVYLNVATGTDIGNTSNIANPILTFKADSGYSLPSSQTISSQSPSSSVSAIGSGSTWSSGVLTLDLSAHTLAADRNITVTLGTTATASSYTLNGTYSVVTENATVSGSGTDDAVYNTEGTYSASGNYAATSTPTFTDGATSSTWNKVFTADSGYYFKDTPTCTITKEDNDIESYYTITSANTTTDANDNVTAVTFTITYKHGAKNITGDVLEFKAPAEKIFSSTIVGADKIINYKIENWDVENERVVISGAEKTELRHEIFGPAGTTFRLARKIITTTGATVTTGDKYYYDNTENTTSGNWIEHNGYDLTPFDLTIPNGGVYTHREEYPKMSNYDIKQFEYEVIPVNPASLASSFVDTNPASIYQYNNVMLTFLTAVSQRFSTTGIATSDSASIAMTCFGDTTSEKKYSVAPYSQTIGYPLGFNREYGGESPAAEFPFTIIYQLTTGTSADKTATNFRALRTPGLYDFRNTTQYCTVLNDTENSTTAELISTNNAIYASNGDGKLDPRTGSNDKTDIALSSFPGMKVTSQFGDLRYYATDEEQIKPAATEDYVSVAGWNYLTKTITFSSPQTLKANTRLILQPANDWNWNINARSGTLDAASWKYTLNGNASVWRFGSKHLTSMLNADRFLWDGNNAINIDADDRPQYQLLVENDGYIANTSVLSSAAYDAAVHEVDQNYYFNYISIIENELITVKNVSDYNQFENAVMDGSADGLVSATGDVLQQFKILYVAVRYGRQYSGLKSSEIELQYYRPLATYYDPATPTSGSPIYSVTGPLNPSFGYRIGATDNRAIGKYGAYAVIGPIQVNFNETVGDASMTDGSIYQVTDKLKFGIRFKTTT